MKKVLLTAVIIISFSISAQALPTFEGMLSTPDEVEATGIWANDFKIAWHVEQMADNSWFYRYNMTYIDGSPILVGAVSHFTIEVSPNVTRNDFWSVNGPEWDLGVWDESDFMPYSLKFDFGGDGRTEWSLYSTRAPVWGDFLAVDGNAGGLGPNTARNAGWDLADPATAPMNGSVDYKILRPDTDTVIPEPGTLGLLGLGLMGVAARLRKRKARK